MVESFVETPSQTVDGLLVPETASVKEAMEQISRNKRGMVFIQNREKKVVGCTTDGDLRSFMIKNNPADFLNKPIIDCMNHNFVHVISNHYNHESLLKLLDSRIKLVPILNENFQLIDYATKESLHLKKQKTTIYRSKSPVRISFAGGGTDISSFFTKHNSFILNATINLFSHVTLKVREDSVIKLISHDLNINETFPSIHDIHKTSHLPLFKTIINILNPPYGFELITRSDVPVGSGLGGSAVMLSAIIGVFDMAFGYNLDQYEIAQMAFQSERINQNIAGGWQDQYSTVFGGFNYIELNNKENIVHPLRISTTILNELEENLILAYTGIKHDSNQIHLNQKDELKKPDKESYAKQMLVISEQMKQKLLKNKLHDFGKLLHESWELKKMFSSQISLPEIDKIYHNALKNGAVGGKLLGAGGGGYLLFYVPSEHRMNVLKTLKSHGLTIEKFQFNNDGLRVWKVANENQK
tara:strand:- start:482 stop:1891 length:1410 start_codon:yes stop_codon:yes gene_type:complete